MTKKILAIFILFHPEAENLTQAVKNCLAYPGCDVFLSDNAEISPELKHALVSPCVTYHNNGGNVGLGAAQNKGLKLALEKNYDYAVLFDQDSQIGQDFLSRLIHEGEVARQKDPSIIAVGPSFIDQRFKGARAKRHVQSVNKYKKMLIASGSMMVVPLLKEVGLMDETFFIDCVDTEWCYRAGSQGFRVMQLADVVMKHTIGETKKLFFSWTMQYQKPFRYYYILRNNFKLMKKKYVPWGEKLHLFCINVRVLAKIIFLDHRWQYVVNACKGIRDGIKA